MGRLRKASAVQWGGSPCGSFSCFEAVLAPSVAVSWWRQRMALMITPSPQPLCPRLSALPVAHLSPPLRPSFSALLPPRRCAEEVEELNHSVMAAADMLLGHASSMRSGIKDLSARVGACANEVQAADALLV